MRSDGQAISEDNIIELDDEKTLEEILEEQNKQRAAEEQTEKARQEQSIANSQQRNRIEEILEDRADLELKKIGKMYDDKTISKLLRMLDMFTSVSLVNQNIARYASKIVSDDFIVLLLKMMVMCQSRHALIISKVLHNLCLLESGPDLLDSACLKLSDSESSETFKLNSVSQFKESPFLKFVFDLLLSIRSNQWRSQDFASSGEYEVSS